MKTLNVDNNLIYLFAQKIAKEIYGKNFVELETAIKEYVLGLAFKRYRERLASTPPLPVIKTLKGRGRYKTSP